MKIIKTITTNFFTLTFTLFWMVFSLGQLQRIQLQGDIAFYLHDIIITIFVVGFLWQNKNNFFNYKKISWPKFRLELSLLALVMVGMLLGSWEGRITPKSWLYLLRLVDYGLFVYALQKVKLTYQPYLGLLIAGTLIGVWGLGQYIAIPDVRFLNIFGWDNHYYRLISTIFDPAFTGIILVLTVGLWQRLINQKPAYQQSGWLTQTILILAIAATFSRASYLALGLLTTHQWLTTNQKIKWSFLGIVFLLTIILLPKPGGEGVNLARTSTLEARSENIQENLITLEGSQWLWGRGLFNNDAQKTSYTNNHAQLPDNLLILVINGTGVIGLTLFGLLTFKWIKIFYKQDKLWGILLITVLIHSLFNNTLLQPFVFLNLFSSKKISND
ncbi:MAG: hypothetical protein ACOZAK_01860 [Patescibacteria group bacterium]